ncbi:hypothetical protein [Sanguibacter suaedae]|uniref:Uncharacterized protein n=1 Tax=Sanguibacter suaedae TaxID=2795737 RepID=A0A934M8L8_9MICO|nr:hypothetical protein [Sanguibacter suaedae]MBI9113695.1 hypothetical protein [Sanguibacter suaedae]
MLGSLIGSLIGSRWQRRRADRRALEQLRAVGKLMKEWKHGTWTIAPGRLTFFRTVVHVTYIEDGYREPSGRESWSVAPDAHIVTLTCPSGTAEWALLPNCREEAVSRLRGRVGLNGPSHT